MKEEGAGEMSGLESQAFILKMLGSVGGLCKTCHGEDLKPS